MDEEIVKDQTRMVITPCGGAGDEIQITKHADGGLDFEIEEPWAGSTETGFGATTSITLSRGQAAALLAWLNEGFESRRQVATPAERDDG